MTTEPVIIPEDEVIALRGLGFCNIGDGYIARIDSRAAQLEVHNNAAKCGVNSYWAATTPHPDPIKIEHVYRTHLAKRIQVGAVAKDLAPSVSTNTHFVRGSEETWAKFEAFRDRITGVPPALLITEAQISANANAVEEAKAALERDREAEIEAEERKRLKDMAKAKRVEEEAIATLILAERENTRNATYIENALF